MDEVKSIGMGSPGSIDDKNGVVLYANNLNLLDAPLCAEVGKHIDKPIYIGNDANCAALGEFFALEDENITDFIAVTLGTGVGGGIANMVGGAVNTAFNGTNEQPQAQHSAPIDAFCENCGAKLTPGAAFCDECGTKVAVPDNVCRNCGYQFERPGKFCPKCGTKREG